MARIPPKLYTSLMRIQVPKKGGGGRPARERRVRHAKEATTDLLRVLFEGDTPDTTDHGKRYFATLDLLSEDQLKKLKAKIKKLAALLFDNKELSTLKMQTNLYIDERLARSRQEKNLLKQQILERRKTLTSCPRTLNMLVKCHFQDLAATYDEKVAAGAIIGSPTHPNGITYVAHILRRFT